MSHNFLLNTSFHKTLLSLDLQTAANIQKKGCTHCGGILHQAHYPRLGFGIPAKMASLYASRQSFCCVQCRKRTTPPSLRFLGQRRYVAPILVLLCALRFSPCETRCQRLAHRYGLNVSFSTWKRWVSWWRHHFPRTLFWRVAKAHFLPPISVNPSIRTLLKQFKATRLSQQLVLLLQFLLPLTISVI